MGSQWLDEHWPMLAIVAALGCAALAGCGQVLAAYARQAIHTHDLVRRSREMRMNYLENVRRQTEGEPSAEAPAVPAASTTAAPVGSVPAGAPSPAQSPPTSTSPATDRPATRSPSPAAPSPQRQAA